MVNVYLHGELGQAIGEEWSLDVDCAAEAISAIEANTGKILNFLSQEDRLYNEYSVLVDDDYIDEDDLQLKKPNKEIHIIPSVEGGKGIVKVIIGVALIVASIMIPGSATGFMAFLKSATMAIGTSLVMGGITELLSKPPKIGESTSTQSFLMGGQVNNASQGQAVPIGYGRLRVGSQVISVKQANKLKESVSEEEQLLTTRQRTWRRLVNGWLEQSQADFEKEFKRVNGHKGVKALAVANFAPGFKSHLDVGLRTFRDANVPDWAKETWDNAQVYKEGVWRTSTGYSVAPKWVQTDYDSLYNNIPEDFDYEEHI